MKPNTRPSDAIVIKLTNNLAVHTATETAYLLSLHRNTVYTWLRNGTLPGFKSCNQWVIPKSRLQKWVDSLTCSPITPQDPKQKSLTESTEGNQ